MSMDMDQFHEVFFEESFESIDAMEAALLRLTPGVADPETINTIFRTAHSIKGGAGMFGFNEIASFTHTMETLLDELRASRLQVTTPMCDGLLQSVDVMRSMMTAQKAQQPLDLSVSQVLQAQFKRMIAGEGQPGRAGAAPAAAPAAAAPPPPVVAPAATAAPAAPATPAPEAAPAAAVANAHDIDPTVWNISFKSLPGLLARGNDPLRIFDELAGLGQLQVEADCSALQPLEAIEPSDCRIAWKLTLTSSAPRTAIDLIFEWSEGDCELSIERVGNDVPEAPVAVPAAVAGGATAAVAPVAAAAGAAAPAAAAAGAKAAAGSPDVNSIRVAIEKIDELLNTVGEIVITNSMLGQLAKDFVGVDADRLRSGLAQLETNVRELQESVMRVRMLPVGSVFSRFPRLVRDLSTRLGKQIRLQLSGEQTELDKTVLEKIGDPLVHLVRNSVDHGIELPGDRTAAGKPEEGLVHLNAYHKGGSINIVLSDDGRGLDARKLIDKARAKGLIAPDAVLTDEQAYELIFAPGFSTAEKTTDLSGRGVGMDVVRRNIKELGGSVELKSELGKGTTTTITLPLTLAIVDGQTVQVGTETYIVPLTAIVESMQLREGTTHQVYEHGEVFHFRDDYLPIIRLHEVFGVEPKSRALSDGLLMVVEGDGRRAGLFIDSLLGQQQVVIKSLEGNYARIEGVGGATILGEGAVALILDIPGLLRMSPRHAPQLQKAG
jgi:two-component system chemotaxis sensor kinase CheA